MSLPSLTVLMTAYNAMPYIMESTASILGQTREDFTFLIINNGSRDGTGDFLAQLERQHAGAPNPAPALKVLHLESNIGRTAVLNKGLDVVDTELTAIMDADDLALPQRLARQTAYFHEHPDVDLVGSDIIYMDPTGNATGEERFAATHEELCERMPLYNQFAHSACMFRTEKARAAGGYSASFPYAQDMALWIAMLSNGCRAASIPETLVRIRMHPGQVTRDLALVMVRAEDNHKLAQAMLDIPCLSRAARQAARLRSAGALLKLRRVRQAARQLWQGFLEAPWLFFVNPLLWRRIALEAKKRAARRRGAFRH